MGTNPDVVADYFLDELAHDQYFDNKSLIKEALRRYEEIHQGGLIDYRRLMSIRLSHVPWQAWEFLYEARMTYCFGFFRSSIFCCAAALDWELKRCLLVAHPADSKKIQAQTFGGSISYLRKEEAPPHVFTLAGDYEWVNSVRNEIAVHAYGESALRSMVDVMDDEMRGRAPQRADRYDLKVDPKEFFSSYEIRKICKGSRNRGIDWPKELALKTLEKTRKTLEKSCDS
jgi:hypothetical protein